MIRRDSLFFNEKFYFEESGDEHIFRPSPFSAGYTLAGDEKTRLRDGLVSLTKRGLRESLIFAALTGALLLAGGLSGDIPAVATAGLIALGFGTLAIASLHRRDRLVKTVLRGRAPDAPARPLREALNKSHSAVNPKLALPGLRFARAGLVAVLVLLDAMSVGLIVYVASSMNAEDAQVADRARQTWSNLFEGGTILFILAALNGLLGGMTLLVTREVRKLRDHEATSNV